jgi:hypothetical protein
LSNDKYRTTAAVKSGQEFFSLTKFYVNAASALADYKKNQGKGILQRYFLQNCNTNRNIILK